MLPIVYVPENLGSAGKQTEIVAGDTSVLVVGLRHCGYVLTKAVLHLSKIVHIHSRRYS